jgi:hypothetical protein
LALRVTIDGLCEYFHCDRVYLGWRRLSSVRSQKNLVNSAHLCFKAVQTALMNQKCPYILRISQKAKRVRFQVSVEKGLEVVVPKRFNPSQLPLLLEKNSQWIERALQKAKSFQGLVGRDRFGRCQKTPVSGGGSPNTGSPDTLCCLTNAYRGCPAVRPYGTELAKQRRKEGIKVVR